MRTPVRILLVAVSLPLFAGCQMLSSRDEAPLRPTERLQGEVTQIDGELLFRSCQGQRSLQLIDTGNTGLPDDVQALAPGGERLFADIRGTLISRDGEQGRMELSRIYRVQHEGHGCNEPDFDQLVMRAGGNEPGWNVRISTQGLLLQRMDHPPVALPYLEEQLPGGQTHFSSEANDLQLQLWVAPQRCVDDASGAVSHLSAELRLDGQTLRGCAYYGKARDD